MSSHNSSQSIVSCTKLCIKNNFLLKFMFSARCFSPSTVCCLVSPAALFLFCWILLLPLSPPAYFHSVQQHSPLLLLLSHTMVLRNTNSLTVLCFCCFLCIPVPLSIRFLLHGLLDFLNALCHFLCARWLFGFLLTCFSFLTVGLFVAVASSVSSCSHDMLNQWPGPNDPRRIHLPCLP